MFHWTLYPIAYFALQRFFKGSASAPTSPSAPRQPKPPAGTGKPTAPAGGTPKPSSSSRTVTLKPGTNYRAILKLSSSTSWAGNELVLQRIQDAAGPFADAQASGSGVNRTVTGRYTGKQRTVTLPPEVLTFSAVGGSSSAPSSSAPSSSSSSKLPDPIKDVLDMGMPPAPSSSSSAKAKKKAKPKPKPKAKPKPKPKAKPKPKPAPKPKAKPKPKPKAKPKPAAKKKPTTWIDVKADQSNRAPAKREPKAAAQALYAYVVPILKAKRGSTLGTKGAPNATVAAAQRDMGLAADGIYGPGTRTRGQQLLGKPFPART